MSDSVVPLWFHFTSLFGLMLLASYLCGKRLAKIISLADAQLKAEREKAMRDAAEVCTNIIKNYDVMEPGKPDQFASLKTQKAAKGMVSLARQDILALISEVATKEPSSNP